MPAEILNFKAPQQETEKSELDKLKEENLRIRRENAELRERISKTEMLEKKVQCSLEVLRFYANPNNYVEDRAVLNFECAMMDKYFCHEKRAYVGGKFANKAINYIKKPFLD